MIYNNILRIFHIMYVTFSTSIYVDKKFKSEQFFKHFKVLLLILIVFYTLLSNIT